MSGANARTMVCRMFFLVTAIVLGVQTLSAQESPGKVYGYEVSGSWLGFAPKGDVQTNSNRVEFESDLGIDGMQSQPAFWFLVKPWYRSGLFGEFIPYRFNGEETITRSFRFGGVTYAANQPVSAKAALNYVSF